MKSTVADPGVVMQMGIRVGMPDAGQINALEALNTRGERSVTCKGAFAAHPENTVPIAMTCFANQGGEPQLIKVGPACESATQHRFASPDFGPVSGEQGRLSHARD